MARFIDYIVQKEKENKSKNEKINEIIEKYISDDWTKMDKKKKIKLRLNDNNIKK